MKPFRLAALSLALLTAFSLTGCDDSGTPQASADEPDAICHIYYALWRRFST
ncbi:hypothetical protein, partial [Klebsiella pneumoniae]|uniref:hypothetical protein n=1 Tax=Klebsiella pneumoniae TaxID=573 RepID=UPI003974869A